MNVLVLGHKGMLGRAATRYFSRSPNSVMTLGSVRYDVAQQNAFIDSVVNSGADVIINAVGKIRQKSPSTKSMYEANARMPLALASRLKENQLLVQPSTDCVFSGKTGKYGIFSEPDPVDDYGLSKLLSESITDVTDHALVIRTSIIGIENYGSNYGLLSWFLSQGKSVNGFDNHIWSGVTVLQWCKSVESLIKHEHRGLCHIAGEPVSKYELLCIAKDVFQKHDTAIVRSAHEQNIDRSMVDSIVQVKSIAEQLTELKRFEET